MRTPKLRHAVTGRSARALPPWRISAPAALFALVLFAPDASAQSRYTPRFSFGGFGTLGLIHSGESRADFVEDFTRPAGVGYSAGVKASVDSRLAGQANMFVGSKLQAVLQVMVDETAAGEYRPRAEWANVSYAFTPDFSVRGGRVVMPAFLVSDARKVSFANPWVRPPVELYGLVPAYSLDGVDATYRARFGEWTGILNAAVGHAVTDFPGGSVDARNLWSVNTTLIRGALTGRIAGGTGELSIDDFSPLFDAFGAFGPEGVEIADRFGLANRRLFFATAGMEYDHGDWFTLSEFAWLDTNSALGERLAGYVTGGIRRGAFTPYATYSRSTLLSESSVAGLTLSGLPPEHAAMAAELNGGLNLVLASPPVQQNLALGARWDFARGIALKAQVEFIDVLGNSAGTFINLQPGFEPGGRARLFSVATAFVF